MYNLSDINDVKGLQSNLHTIFDGEPGKEVMRFLEAIGGWYPNIYDSIDTNEIIARDANRRLLGTIKTLLKLSADQIVELSKVRENGST